ncbi:MAG: DUF6442 family protein [Tissierella sp.]|uniref:DUF6442 family protein n=1 Tax=Tissierella sp. TaxID=41274 RepID=UPI003F992FB0
MNRDEVLEKAKRENLINDEAKNNKNLKGNQWGLAASGIVIFVIIIINYMNDKNISHLLIIYGSYIGFQHLGKYFANKEKTDLISAFGGLLLIFGSSLLWMADLWNL